jgi:regulator of nucleoside diphosphate kinase
MTQLHQHHSAQTHHAASTNWTLSKLDFERLRPLVSAPAHGAAKNAIDELDLKLASAMVVAPTQIDGDVVTMNSKVLVHCSSWEKPREYRLVYPRDGLVNTGEVSVVSPLGAELLGMRVGTRFTLGQGRSFELIAVTYQPEAAGDWLL